MDASFFEAKKHRAQYLLMLFETKLKSKKEGQSDDELDEVSEEVRRSASLLPRRIDKLTFTCSVLLRELTR